MSAVKQCDNCGKTEGDTNELDWWIEVRSFGSQDFCSKECAVEAIAVFDMSREELIDDPDSVPSDA